MSVWKNPAYCLLADKLNGFVDTAHGNACRAGWWGQECGAFPEDVSLARGNSTFGAALVAQKLCLTHSEISEAMEGHRKGLMDDKLPHRKMIEVELADAMIRIADLAGALGLDLGGAIVEKMEYNANREDHKLENRQKAGGKAY